MSSAMPAMPSLRVRFHDGERFIVNGAVIGIEDEALVVHKHDTLLKGEDVILPEQADSPARRIYFGVMMMILDPRNHEAHYGQLVDDLAAMLQATSLADVADTLHIIFTLAQRGHYERALESARALVKFETELLRTAPAPAEAA